VQRIDVWSHGMGRWSRYSCDGSYLPTSARRAEETDTWPPSPAIEWLRVPATPGPKARRAGHNTCAVRVAEGAPCVRLLCWGQGALPVRQVPPDRPAWQVRRARRAYRAVSPRRGHRAPRRRGHRAPPVSPGRAVLRDRKAKRTSDLGDSWETVDNS